MRNGNVVIANTETDEVTSVFAQSCDVKDVFIVNHTARQMTLGHIWFAVEGSNCFVLKNLQARHLPSTRTFISAMVGIGKCCWLRMVTPTAFPFSPPTGNQSTGPIELVLGFRPASYGQA